MQNLTTQAKAADAKAVQLFEQYSSLLKALEDKEAERNTLLDQIKAATQEAKVSKEDLGIPPPPLPSFPLSPPTFPRSMFPFRATMQAERRTHFWIISRR